MSNSSGELIVPGDEPWMSHAFVTKLATQVSLPYRRPSPGVSRIVRSNGTLSVTFSATNTDGILPFGKYPRLFEMWACTMVKTANPCYDPETRTIHLGTTFREFLRTIGINVGGRQLHTIKPQLEHLFACTYAISNNNATHSQGIAFTVAEKWRIDWLSNEPQEHGLFENWVTLSEGYVDKLKDSPVPVDLSIVAKLRSPIALDIYWWLSRRYSYLHTKQSIKWSQLYGQFGSSASPRKFKQNFKAAVAEVLDVYPGARITCGRDYVTLYPSATSVPTTAQTRHTERIAAKTHERDGHWFEVMGENGKGQVYGSLEDYSLADARAHLSGEVLPDECPVCAYDARNRELHGV